MEAYRDQYASLFRGGRDVILLAVSTDPVEEHASWAADADFPFLFGSDPGATGNDRTEAIRTTARCSSSTPKA